MQTCMMTIAGVYGTVDQIDEGQVKVKDRFGNVQTLGWHGDGLKVGLEIVGAVGVNDGGILYIKIAMDSGGGLYMGPGNPGDPPPTNPFKHQL